MKIKDNLNYCILSNNITKEFIKNFNEYQIIDELPFKELIQKLEFFSSKQVVFNEAFYSLKQEEINYVLDLLKKQNVNYLNITSNIEEALFSDYIIVYDNDNIVLEGNRNEVLANEKLFKRLGYGLPFVVDLSTQLQVYEVLNKTYYSIASLVGDLWN